ncbi:carboxymuconolactone decarboxylase family protein [Kaarinaea lacus]
MKNGYEVYNTQTASDEARLVLEQVQQHYQFVPNALGAMVESPEAVKSYLTLDELVSQNSLTDEQRHVAFLTIAREYNCSYCVAAHTAFAQMGQVDSDMIERLREGSLLNDGKLEALQQFVGKLIKTGCQVSEQDIERFLSYGYTRRNILEIITMMANKLIAVFANRVMGTDLDEALQPAVWHRVA